MPDRNGYSNDESDGSFDSQVFNEDKYNLKNIAEEDSLYFDKNREENENQMSALKRTWEKLTVIQRQLLSHIGRGMTVQDAATELDLTYETALKYLNQAKQRIKREHDRYAV